MTPFVRNIVDFSRKSGIFSCGARVLVALSGGPDSCALLLALVEAAESGELPRPIGAAHFHHGVRGKDADEDAAFCAALCSRLSLPGIIGLGAVPKRNGGYSSATARRLRYEFLQEAAADLDADLLATAHNANDQAETVLGRVLRGTSVDGLAGIPVSRRLSESLTVVRPLLTARRHEIEEYCRDKQIIPRHDPSNDKERYTRTRLRRLLPELAQRFNPNVYEALNRLSENAALDSELLTGLADSLWAEVLQEKSDDILILQAERLRTAHPAIRRRVLLRAIFSATPEAVEEAATAEWVNRLDSILQVGGEITLPGDVHVALEANNLYFQQRKQKEIFAPYSISLPVPGRILLTECGLSIETRLESRETQLIRVRRSKIVDLASDPGSATSGRLVVRPAQTGERIAPLGFGGRTRLVRDMLADAKIPVEEREQYPVVASEETGQILWLIGIAQAEVTRVTEETVCFLRIVVHNTPEKV